jgi:hypothetical protein
VPLIIATPDRRPKKEWLVGQVPLVGPRLFAFSPKTTYSSLFDFRVGYQRLGFYTPSVEIGMSPVGGALAPTLVGKIGLTGLEDWGSWNANIYRNSVKQSFSVIRDSKIPTPGPLGAASPRMASCSRLTITSGNYSEFTAAAFMRFFFEPRIGLFGTDF